MGKKALVGKVGRSARGNRARAGQRSAVGKPTVLMQVSRRLADLWLNWPTCG